GLGPRRAGPRWAPAVRETPPAPGPRPRRARAPPRTPRALLHHSEPRRGRRHPARLGADRRPPLPPRRVNKRPTNEVRAFWAWVGVDHPCCRSPELAGGGPSPPVDIVSTHGNLIRETARAYPPRTLTSYHVL